MQLFMPQQFKIIKTSSKVYIKWHVFYQKVVVFNQKIVCFLPIPVLSLYKGCFLQNFRIEVV